MSFTKKSSNKVSGGTLTKYAFNSTSLNSLETAINVFLPSSASSSPVPVLYFLSGLTCTEDNAAQKGGFFNAAEAAQIALVFQTLRLGVPTSKAKMRVTISVPVPDSISTLRKNLE